MAASTSVPAISLRALLQLAWPIVISRSTQVAVGLSDALMVAPLGQNELAATTTGAFNAYALLIFPMGIVFIVSSFASQLFGAGDAEGARRYGFYGLAVAAATQVVCLVSLPALPAVLGLLDYTPEVRALAIDYLWYRLLSGGAAIGMEALSNYYGGLGNTRLPMLFSVGAMVVNIFGNWVLISGHLGAPAMGVAGAALASSISTWVMFLGFAAIFLVRRGRLLPAGLKLGELGRMLRFGLPSGFNWFFEFFAFNFFINTVMAGLGTTALAAFMAVLQINSVAFMPAFALASAGAILVGQCIGASRQDDVPRALGLTWAVAATWQGLVSVAYVAVPQLLMEPFANEEARAAGLLVVGSRMLRLSAAWQLFDASATTLAETLRAAGDTAFTMWSRIVLGWALFVPGSWITVRTLGHGDVAAVAWVVLYLAALAGTLWWRFKRGAWRRIHLIDGATPAHTPAER